MKGSNLNSSETQRVNAASLYKECLLQHKEFIEKNKFARELELKYHRTIHKSLKPHKLNEESKEVKFHHWPVESEQFTNALRIKLENSLLPKLSVPYSHKNKNDLSIVKLRKSLKLTREKLRSNQESNTSEDDAHFRLNSSIDKLPKIKIPNSHSKSPRIDSKVRKLLSADLDGDYPVKPLCQSICLSIH
ncbi:unnamed protein product [Blepharisma stoltei]|uniref:Uncharacterized protein n=1 Tax=Blepharisma stoltei TaxID=1481888 RepID=A0AAU9JD50_9CILI|nr:unnamed protein product [Blepharisma stoltei]